MIRQSYYIGTGRKLAMFTLRVLRTNDDPRGGFFRDSHLCNLAGIDNEERAIAKGREYAEAMRDRIGPQEGFEVVFQGVWDEPMNRRRGRLSVRDTQCIEKIEAGVFPFGKHVGQPIADAPESYVLFFADKMGDAADPVAFALAAACQGVALQRGLIVKRDAARAAQRELDLQSKPVGTPGDRLDFDAEVMVVVNRQPTDFAEGFQMTKLRCGANILIYYGLIGQQGDRYRPGDRISLRATVKKHTERDGITATVIQRPKVA